MGEMVLGRNLIDYTIENVSNEFPLWPATNLLIFDKRVRYWQTTVITEVNVVIDLGAPTALKSIAIIDVNYNSLKIQGNDTDSWGSPSFNPGLVTVEADKLTEIYRKQFYEQYLDTFNYRYLRLVIPAQTPVDNDTKFRTGVLAVSVDSEEFVYGGMDNMPMKRNQAVSVADMHGGGQEKATNGVPYASISFDMPRLRNETDFTQMAEQLISIGETELVIFSPADEIIEEPNTGQYCYIMRRTTAPEYTINRGVNNIPVSLRESV